MSKTTVKKALAQLDAEALREMIMEMYAARREARDYLEFWVNPDTDRELDTAKTKIQKLFFMSADKPRRKPDFAEIKTIINNFETLCPEPELICDLLLYIPETMIAWLKARRGTGMIGNKPRIEKAVANASAFMESRALESQFGLRLERLKNSFEDLYTNQPAKTGRSRRGYWWHY